MPLVKKREVPLRVSDIMTRNVVTAKRDDKIKDIAAKMYENKVGSAVIVDDEGKAIGIITERDLVYVIARGLSPDTPAWMVMTENPIVIDQDALVVEAMEKMRELNIRHLPVVDKAGKVVGVVSFRDIVDFAATMFSLLR
ncbi:MULTISPECIES: CBS domain-containing protein [Pyrobaculum]|uniref:CBS domain-containing protein n=3 Tax=Pyrobaculum TaxID=2276 RepID=A0A7L4P8R8_9CREN|nr:CBS domain-containing protein [Pyrobaculum arsenaticum]ABP50895.1 putative signal-transduction protein with CBS domains [Pyrobaculum arsenaticum DSM 13514]AFA38909.1 putative signal-transduction protein containing cAMP-binding and CBS domains [Pyrobaculum oguniense TE7]MCY0891316.1 CBS domain-containing protein [Pyrobaculum arsenaticum]NYR15385.1 CBS domain-containing protein [Pyrobaculum arsenaticum]